jgi:hypothetical protein
MDEYDGAWIAPPETRELRELAGTSSGSICIGSGR